MGQSARLCCLNAVLFPPGRRRRQHQYKDDKAKPYTSSSLEHQLRLII